MYYYFKGDHKTRNLDLFECWKLGKENALLWLEPYGYNSLVIEEDLKNSASITMIHPRGMPLIIEEVVAEDSDVDVEDSDVAVEDSDVAVEDSDAAVEDSDIAVADSDVIEPSMGKLSLKLL